MIHPRKALSTPQIAQLVQRLFVKVPLENSVRRGDTKSALEKCIRSLPDNIQKTVALDIALSDFEQVLCPA
jgi:hypothetical protein